MTADNVIPIERDPHRAAQALLPWYLSGRLDEGELAALQQHLDGCPQCRAELDAERRLLSQLPPGEGAGGDVEAGLRRVRARLPERASTGQQAGGRRRPVAPLPRWFGWALGLQGAVVAGLLVLMVLPRLHAPHEPADYRGLSASTVVSADALVMFDPAASEAQIRRVLQASDATLVGGPTAADAYLLRLAGDATQQRQALQRLRAEPVVRMAEALQGGERR